MLQARLCFKRFFLIAMGCFLAAIHLTASPALAQDWSGLFDPNSPLVYFPQLQGQVKVRPIWVHVVSGTNTIPAYGIKWGVRDHFHIQQPRLYLDAMVKFTGGRFSLRGEYEQRELIGRGNFQDVPSFREGEARIDYTGLRLGVDFDVFQRYSSRLGVNMDYDLYRPVFTEALRTTGGKKMLGDSAMTMGIHASYNPYYGFWGITPLLEARIRWPVVGAEVTDWTISAGIKSPLTVVGSWALGGGYRETTLKFRDGQTYNSTPVSTVLDVTLGGWFAEFVYIY